MTNKKLFLGFAAGAILIKIFLFVFSAVATPDMKIETDSASYLKMAERLFTKGAFLRGDDSMLPEIYRTPGYPVFLGIVHDVGKVPLDGVIFLQVLFTIITAWVVYRVAMLVEPRIAALSALIVLFDVPSTVWSLRIMTEALFTLLLILVIWGVVLYFKKVDVRALVCSALLLVLATYVRPVSYFLGIPIAGFMIYVNAPKNIRKAIGHAVIFLAIVFGLLALWSLRNWHCARTLTFAAVSAENQQVFSVTGSYAQERYPKSPGVPDVVYYGKITWISLTTMMFSPGSWKYFHDSLLGPVGKVLAYLLMIVWLPGFCVGIFKMGRNIYYQFFFLICSYFILVTVYNVGLVANERFRVVIVPCIAMLSAYGWAVLLPPRKTRDR